MHSEQRPASVLARARSLAPTVAGLALAAQVCVSSTAWFFTALTVGMGVLVGSALISGRHGLRLIVEAGAVAAAQFLVHHLSVSPGRPESSASDLVGCATALESCATRSTHDLLVVLVRIFLAVLLLVTLLIAQKHLIRRCLSLPGRVLPRPERERRLIAHASRQHRIHDAHLRAITRRGPPLMSMSRLRAT